MSTTNTVIAPTASAVSTTLVDASNYEWVTIVADQLGGSEECDIYVRVNGTYVPALNKDLDGPAVLTPTITALTLQGGLEYGVAKDATPTNGACGVFVTYGPARSK